MSEDLHQELDRLALAVVIEEVAERLAHRVRAHARGNAGSARRIDDDVIRLRTRERAQRTVLLALT